MQTLFSRINYKNGVILLRKLLRITSILIIFVFMFSVFQIGFSKKTSNINFNRKIVIAETEKDNSEESIFNIELSGVKADDFYFEELMNSYENLLIDAINNNRFSSIECLLVPESKLYNAQKKLVSDLFRKGIKEELISYSIEDIKPTTDEGVFKLYVYEKVGIRYPRTNHFVIKQFYWIYTVTVKDNLYRLSDIEKWK